MDFRTFPTVAWCVGSLNLTGIPRRTKMFLSNTTIDARDGIHSANEEAGMRPNDSMNAGRKWIATVFAVLGCMLMVAVADRGAEAAMSDGGGGPGSDSPVRQNPANPLFGETTDPDCRCNATFSGVGVIEVTSCDELSTAWCGEEMSLPDSLGSADFEGCECTCLDGYELTAKSVSRSDEDGFFVRGVPDFWQFRHGCDNGSRANMVGCGPVAMAEILYWYGSRGYPELVDNHEVSDVTTSVIYEIILDTLAAQGISEPGVWHAWKTLTTELRDDYAKGICMPAAFNGQGLYATTENGFMDGLSQYASDRGVALDVDGFKIDRDNANYGLNLIKKELKAGRPLVMRFNSNRSFKSFFTDDETGEDIFSGKLSNGSWFNDHYAVVTGFRKTSTGRDVLYLNMGGGFTRGTCLPFSGEATCQPEDPAYSGTDTPVEWNPAGEWVRLYTVEVVDEPSGSSNCESSLTLANDPRYFPMSYVKKRGGLLCDTDGDGIGDGDACTGEGKSGGKCQADETCERQGTLVDLGFSHEDLHSTYTEFSQTTSQELDDCGSVLDYEEIYEPIWRHEELVCPNEAEPDSLEPEDLPSGIGGRLGP